MLILTDAMHDMLLSRAGTVINLYELYFHVDSEPICFTSGSEDISYKPDGASDYKTY